MSAQTGWTLSGAKGWLRCTKACRIHEFLLADFKNHQGQQQKGMVLPSLQMPIYHLTNCRWVEVAAVEKTGVQQEFLYQRFQVFAQPPSQALVRLVTAHAQLGQNLQTEAGDLLPQPSCPHACPSVRVHDTQ